MLLHLCRPVTSLIRSLKLPQKSLPRLCSTVGGDISNTDQKQLSAGSGYVEPIWYWDEEEEKNVIGNKSTEHFSFDPVKGIHQEPEDERLSFQKYVAKFGQARFSNKPYHVHPRDFEMSRDPAEWEFVQRLLPPSHIPPIPKLNEYPSGFRPARITPGSDEAVKIGYFVSRSVSHLLPVHTKYDRVRNEVTTKIAKCEGNLFKLRDDLDQFLYDRYHMKFNSRVTEIYGKVKYLGDFEVDFKEFLLEKGF